MRWLWLYVGNRHITPLTPRWKMLSPPSHYKSSAVAEMGDRGHNRHGSKRGGAAVALSRGESGSPSNTLRPGMRFTSVPSGVFIHPAVWSQYTCAENWVLSPSNIKSPNPRPTTIQSGILVHPATTNMCRKLGCPRYARGSWVPI